MLANIHPQVPHQPIPLKEFTVAVNVIQEGKGNSTKTSSKC